MTQLITFLPYNLIKQPNNHRRIQTPKWSRAAKPPHKTKLPCYLFGEIQQPPHLLGCSTTDRNGEDLLNWTKANNISLIINAKQPANFQSGHWKKDYLPDHMFHLSWYRRPTTLSVEKSTNINRYQCSPCIVHTKIQMELPESRLRKL